MKSKIKSIFVIFTLIILTASCSNDSNSTSGNFTLKYEIITSSPVVALNGAFTSILYENGTQAPEFDYSFISGTTWSKQLNVTTPNRPYQAILLTSQGIGLSAPGTVTAKIYVNGTVVSQSTNPTNTVVNQHYAVVSMNYLIQ